MNDDINQVGSSICIVWMQHQVHEVLGSGRDTSSVVHLLVMSLDLEKILPFVVCVVSLSGPERMESNFYSGLDMFFSFSLSRSNTYRSFPLNSS